MENISIHHSLTTIQNFKRLKNIRYFSAFSPELAPVELFFRVVKNKIRGFDFSQVYSLLNQIGRKLIFFNVLKTHKREVLWIYGMNSLL